MRATSSSINSNLHIIQPEPRLFAPSLDGRGLLFYNDAAKTTAALSHLPVKEGARYAEFAAVLEEMSEVFGRIASITPPAIDHPSPEDFWNLLTTGRAVRGLGKTGIFDLLRWGPMAVADFVAEFFDTELLRAAIAARGIFGANLGPWSAGSTALLLLRAAADPHPVGSAAFSARRAWRVLARVIFGEVLLKAPQALRFAPTRKCSRSAPKAGAVSGVVLADGDEIACEAVVSGVDPKRTFFQVLDPSNLDPVFAMRMKNFRVSGSVAKVHLALGELPHFTSLSDTVAPDSFREALSGRIHIGHEIDYLEKAFDASKYWRDFCRAGS